VTAWVFTIPMSAAMAWLTVLLLDAAG